MTLPKLINYAKLAGIWAVFYGLVMLILNIGAFIATAQANTKLLREHTEAIGQLKLTTADVPEIKGDVKELLKKVERLDAYLSTMSKE